MNWPGLPGPWPQIPSAAGSGGAASPPTAPNRRHRKLRRGLELAARAECGGDSTQRLPIGLIPRKRVPEVITKSLPALWA